MRKSTDKHDTGHVVVLDIETIVPGEQPEGGGFPKWPLHRPVVASLLTASHQGGGHWEFALDNIVMTEGKEAEFYTAVDAALPQAGVLVTANGRGFDLPNLALGAMAHRSFAVPNLSAQFRDRRYGSLHADICDLFSNHGGAPKPSLSEICSQLAIPVKVDTHGSEVGDLVAAGEIDRVVRYCASDVAATYVAWLHYAAMRDHDDSVIAEPLAAFARWIEANSELAHLMPVATCQPAMWARRRAVALAFARGEEDAERRMRRMLTQEQFSGNSIIGYIHALPDSDPGF